MRQVNFIRCEAFKLQGWPNVIMQIYIWDSPGEPILSYNRGNNKINKTAYVAGAALIGTNPLATKAPCYSPGNWSKEILETWLEKKSGTWLRQRPERRSEAKGASILCKKENKSYLHKEIYILIRPSQGL